LDICQRVSLSTYTDIEFFVKKKLKEISAKMVLKSKQKNKND